MCSKLPRMRCWARSKTICSARSTSSGVSPGRSQPSRWISFADDREPAQRRHLADDLRVVPGVRRRGDERRDLVDPLLARRPRRARRLVELVGDRDRVDRLALLVEVERRAVDLRVRLRGRSRRRRCCRSYRLDRERREHHRAEHGLLGIQVLRRERGGRDAPAATAWPSSRVVKAVGRAAAATVWKTS